MNKKGISMLIICLMVGAGMVAVWYQITTGTTVTDLFSTAPRSAEVLPGPNKKASACIRWEDGRWYQGGPECLVRKHGDKKTELKI